MRYMSEKEIVILNAVLIKRLSPSEQIGVKDANLLHSAVHRPMYSAFEEDAYPGVFGKAAALYESLAQNHAFHNANKRTAAAAMVTFLKKNGYNLQMGQTQLEDFTVRVVLKEYTFKEIVSIIKECSIERKK